MTGIKYNLTPLSLSPGASPVPALSSRLSDLDQQMRAFIAEKRAHGLHHHHVHTTHSRMTSINTDKSLPTPPGPLSSPPVRQGKLIKLSKKPPKPKLRLIPPKGKAAMATSGTHRLVITRPDMRIVPHLIPWNTSSILASSLPEPSSDKFQRRMGPWKKRRRLASFAGSKTAANRGDLLWASLATPEFEMNPQPCTSPECSPLLPPPRGNSIQPYYSGDLRIVPPPVQSGRAASPAPTKCQSRAHTAEIPESVPDTYPRKIPRAPPSMSADSTEDIILPHRMAPQPPRIPPPPPTPAKSWAQMERARMSPQLATPSWTPVGFVAELEGSRVEVRNDISSASIVLAVGVVDDKSRGRTARPSRIISSFSPPQYIIPKGKEIYTYLPLPPVPSPSQSHSPSPIPGRMHKPSESSPVIDIQLEIGGGDGLVQWFENFRWGEGISAPSLIPGTPTTARTETNSSNTCTLALLSEPKVPGDARGTFRINERASVLHPDGAARNGEHSRPALLPSSTGMASNVVLLSPIYLESPKLASCYGSRSSFASSAGDAFRFDLEVGEALSDVEEGHEEQEVDADELCLVHPVGENVKILGRQVLNGWELSVDGAYDNDRNSEDGQGDKLGIDDLYRYTGYEDDSDTSNEFDTRLEKEIEMILNGTYGGGSSDDWRDGIDSADYSPDEWEEEIIVGLDIDLGKVEERNVKREMDEVIRDEGGWSERPRTRYIAGRNSMLDSDVIFCLRGIDSM